MEYVSTNVICPVCKYQNSKKNVQIYGTCTGCRSRGITTILDNKVYFKRKMSNKLCLWRKDLKYQGKKYE